jgi:hypothetical protein
VCGAGNFFEIEEQWVKAGRGLVEHFEHDGGFSDASLGAESE